VTETVVDDLETVKIEKDDRKSEIGRAFGSLDRHVQTISKQRSVRQSGQAIVKRRVTNQVLRFLAI
jgi:hypothetical protein